MELCPRSRSCAESNCKGPADIVEFTSPLQFPESVAEMNVMGDRPVGRECMSGVVDMGAVAQRLIPRAIAKYGGNPRVRTIAVQLQAADPEHHYFPPAAKVATKD